MMLYPETELVEEKHLCTVCGSPNFRSVSEWQKPLYKIFKVTIPERPCGEATHYLCEDCLRKIFMDTGLTGGNE